MKQTTRSLVTALIVLGIAAAVGGAAVWVTRDTEKKTEQKERSARLFEGLDKAKVRQVKLVRGGKLVAVVSRADASAPWKISEPVTADADTMAVSGMVDALETLKQKSEIGDADPKQYGLENPAIVVSVKTDDGKEQAVEFGETNPFDSSVYVRKQGEKTVRIADGSTKTGFEKQLFDLRDKQVLHVDLDADVRRIEVAGTSPGYTLEKDGASWKMVAPQKEPADSNAADAVASVVKSLRATGVAAESADAAALKQFGLSPPRITAQVTIAADPGKNTFRRTLLLGQPAPSKGSVAVKTYAKRDDSATVFEVDPQITKDLQKSVFDLQDKLLVHVNREDVRKIVFAQPGSPRIVVERKKEQPKDGGVAEETFAVLEPKAGAAKKWKVSNTLYSITGLRATAFAAKPDAKTFEGARTVTLLGDGDKVLAKLRIGAETKDGKHRYASSESMLRVAEVEKSTVDDFPKTIDDVLEPPAAPPAGPPSQAAK
jgi:Domain of unknown function (DUF4340)